MVEKRLFTRPSILSEIIWAIPYIVGINHCQSLRKVNAVDSSVVIGIRVFIPDVSSASLTKGWRFARINIPPLDFLAFAQVSSNRIPMDAIKSTPPMLIIVDLLSVVVNDVNFKLISSTAFTSSHPINRMHTVSGFSGSTMISIRTSRKLRCSLAAI